MVVVLFSMAEYIIFHFYFSPISKFLTKCVNYLYVLLGHHRNATMNGKNSRTDRNSRQVRKTAVRSLINIDGRRGGRGRNNFFFSPPTPFPPLVLANVHRHIV